MNLRSCGSLTKTSNVKHSYPPHNSRRAFSDVVVTVLT